MAAATEEAGQVPGNKGAVRTRYGLICLTPGNAKVALVRMSDTGAWQFPSVLPPQDTERLEEQLEAALSVAENQLGLDVVDYLCSQPVIHALGPEPRISTKFFMAFNVPEVPLVPADGALAAQRAQAASWEDLQGLWEETADQPVAGNQLVAVLRQLQSMARRRYEMVMPADDGYREVAQLLSWHEDSASRWKGPTPTAYLQQHCKDNNLPAPCYNVFEHGRTPARTHFCATALLPHLGLQLTPDAVYPSPVDAMENAALLAMLYLEGTLAPDCPLVHFAHAGDMAQVPHAFVTEHEVRADAAAAQSEVDKQKRLLEKQVKAEQAALQRRLEELKRQQEALAAGDLPGLHPAAAIQQQGGAGAAGGAAAAAAVAGERAAKKLKVDKAPLTVAAALASIPPAKHPLMALKEMCDKCRFQLPRYQELKQANGTTRVAIAVPEAGVEGMVGPPHEDKKQAKVLAAEAVLGELRKRHAA